MTLQQLLGIELPVIQAPMAGVQGSALAVAVSNAGGLGSLPCAMLSLDAMRHELAAIKAQTARPFNVNFFCHAPPTPSVEREAAWRAALSPYYKEFGIDPDTLAAGPGRAPFNSEAADVLSEFKPEVVSFHFGLPSAELLARVKAWGAKILSSATTVEEARWLAAHGADAIIAQGLEAGGHRGLFLSEDLSTQVGTFALVPQIVQAVKLPVMAAGGIADAKGVAAAMALGAAGVQVGTAYLLCPEAATSAVHRAALKSAAARCTALTNLFTGRPARGIVNRIMKELGPISTAAPAFPLVTISKPINPVLKQKTISKLSGGPASSAGGDTRAGRKQTGAGPDSAQGSCHSALAERGIGRARRKCARPPSAARDICVVTSVWALRLCAEYARCSAAEPRCAFRWACHTLYPGTDAEYDSFGCVAAPPQWLRASDGATDHRSHWRRRRPRPAARLPHPSPGSFLSHFSRDR